METELRLWDTTITVLTKATQGIQKQESMEPQGRHTDIHKEEMTKTQFSSETGFGTGLLENTPPLRDCPTVALQLCVVMMLCTSGPELEWATWARGQLGMTAHRCGEGQLGHTHATSTKMKMTLEFTNKTNRGYLFLPFHDGWLCRKWTMSHSQVKCSKK